ncbi:hypothetical protein [Desulfolucanica intricata]|uniref:hypothetical protein n=1 Tax=Desulfolucanica intricata TaxID=1285191 RepID=UPI0008366854|nr:hypothetical protein [Desulfolucanica intricata]
MAKNGLKREQKTCILEDGKICDNCCECYICEIDPTKICDNCAKCLGLDESFEVDYYDHLIFEEDLEEDLEDNKKGNN